MLYQGESLYLDWLEDGIAELVFDAADSVNTLNTTVLASLSEALATLEKTPSLTGLLVRSAAPLLLSGLTSLSFCLCFWFPPPKLSDWLHAANIIFNRLEDLPVPTLTIVNGYTLGGGCECALATDFRLATADTRIGLPETRLGIMPGFGGSVRLPRLVGADNAMEMIATGRELNAEDALKMRLADGIISLDNYREAALSVLRQAAAGSLNWQERRATKKRPLRLNATEATMSFSLAKARVAQQAGKHYPAPMAAIKAIEAASGCDREGALRVENQYFVPLAQSPEARALVGLFLSEQYVKNRAKRLSRDASPPRQAAVLGAGIMGGGIACQSALRGVPVLLKDIHEKALTLGMSEVSKRLSQRLDRGKMDVAALMKTMSAVRPVLDYADFARAEIVVEAVIENPQIKKAVLAETELHVATDATLASNTSTIPVTELATALQRPENFCGMHFFNPVHRMPLVEVIRGSKTSEQTIARVVAWARQMGKTPVVVNDCPGFFVNRVLFPYFAAFSQLLQDGAEFEAVDRVMENQFGWPMGPAYLLDVVGIDTARHAREVMAAGFPERMAKNSRDAIDILFEAGRYGQKTGQGFYRYHSDSKGKRQKLADPTASELLGSVGLTPRPLHADEIIARMMIPMANEVVRCLEEQIIASPAEADIALVYGLGFPPFHGGLFRWLDNMGTRSYLDMAQAWQHLGPLYQVPDSLRLKACQNEAYYPPVTPFSLTHNGHKTGE